MTKPNASEGDTETVTLATALGAGTGLPVVTSEVAAAQDALIAEALATRIEPKGVALAVETIRAKLDEDAHVLWMANGPRKSHIEELGAILVSVEGVRHVMIVQGMASGDFKLFHEIPGKKGFDQIETLIAAGGED